MPGGAACGRLAGRRCLRRHCANHRARHPRQIGLVHDERRCRIDDAPEGADPDALLDEAPLEPVHVGDGFEFDHA